MKATQTFSWQKSFILKKLYNILIGPATKYIFIYNFLLTCVLHVTCRKVKPAGLAGLAGLSGAREVRNDGQFPSREPLSSAAVLTLFSISVRTTNLYSVFLELITAAEVTLGTHTQINRVCVCVCVRAWVFQAGEQKHFSTGDGSLRVSSTIVLLAARFSFNCQDFFFLPKPTCKRFFPSFFFSFSPTISLSAASFDLITATCCRLPAVVSERTASTDQRRERERNTSDGLEDETARRKEGGMNKKEGRRE